MIDHSVNLPAGGPTSRTAVHTGDASHRGIDTWPGGDGMILMRFCLLHTGALAALSTLSYVPCNYVQSDTFGSWIHCMFFLFSSILIILSSNKILPLELVLSAKCKSNSSSNQRLSTSWCILWYCLDDSSLVIVLLMALRNGCPLPHAVTPLQFHTDYCNTALHNQHTQSTSYW